MHLNRKQAMKTQKMSVHIPEPCHEDWNKMLPDEKASPTERSFGRGKFCLSCSKSVHDFSDKTDLEIQHTLMSLKGEKVCGRFNKSQLDRPLNIRVNLQDLPKNMNTTHSFAIAVFLVFGSLLFSCTDSYGQKMGKIRIERPVDNNNKQMLGEVSIAPAKNDTSPTTKGEPKTKILPPDTIRTDNEVLIKGDIKVELPVMGKMEMVYPEQNPDSTWEKEQGNVTDIPKPEEEFTSGGLVAIEYHEETEEDRALVAEMLNENSFISMPETGLVVYPNPGASEITFSYELKQPSAVSLRIYSEKGELLKTIVEMNEQHSGQYRIPANLSDLSPGLYFATLVQDGRRVTKRVVIER